MFQKYEQIAKENDQSHIFPFMSGPELYGVIEIKTPKSCCPYDTLQTFLDQYMYNEEVKIDYIHGEEVLLKLGL